MPVDTERYLKINASEERIISTAHLPTQVGLWRESIALSDEEKSSHSDDLDKDLIRIQKFVNLALHRKARFPSSEVCFSIFVLWDTFMKLKIKFFPGPAKLEEYFWRCE